MNHWFLVFWLSWAASKSHHSDLLETETSLTILTLLLTNMIHLFGHEGLIPHRFFIFTTILLCLSWGLKPNYPLLNSNVNTTKSRVQSIMGAMTAFGWMDGFQWASAQLLKYKGRKKELISHWVMMIITFLCKSFSVAFPFNEAFSSPKTSLCLSKSKDCWNFLPARKNLYPKNPTYPKVPISATDCTDFELNLHLSGKHVLDGSHYDDEEGKQGVCHTLWPCHLKYL